MATRDSVRKEGMNIQGALKEIGPEKVTDLTPEEIAAHAGMIVSLDADLVDEEKIDSSHGSVSAVTSEEWEETYNFAESVQDIALSKPGNEDGKAAMKRVRAAGGFSVTRARKLAGQVLGALTLYDEGFEALGKTKAEIIATLQATVDRDQRVVDKHSALQGIQSRIRNAVKALDAENDRFIRILKATFKPGTPERDVVDRAEVKRRGGTKQTTLPDPSH